jgi:hypothetical protein
MPATTFDDSRFPIVVATAFGTPTAGEYEAFLAALDGYLGRGRHAVILDANRASPLPAVLRRRQAEWIAARAPLLKRGCAAFTVVISNPLIRGTITAINWLSPSTRPVKVVATLAEGEAWSLAQLAA